MPDIGDSLNVSVSATDRLSRRAPLPTTSVHAFSTAAPRPHTPARATHRRNLSLDFRSMGIVLPSLPPQKTSFRRTHHRNRSLDSVLQEDPELEVIDESPISAIKPALSCSLSAGAVLPGSPAAVVCSRPSSGTDARHASLSRDSADRIRHSAQSVPCPDSPAGPVTALPCREGCNPSRPEDTTSLGSTDSGINCDSTSDPGDEAVTASSCRPSSVPHQTVMSSSCPQLEEPAPTSTESPCDDSSSIACCPRTEGEHVPVPPLPAANTSWLLRLFESKLFDMSIAISYLFKSKEPGVLSYIVNRMFGFDESAIDFFLPQLINMYIQMPDVAEALQPYLIQRCRRSLQFSVSTVWLLDAYGGDVRLSAPRRSHVTKLRQLILSNNLRSSNCNVQRQSGTDVCDTVPCVAGGVLSSSGARRTHQRSRSDATASYSRSHQRGASLGSNVRVMGDLVSGRAFDSDCTCSESQKAKCNQLLGQPIDCVCGASRLRPQLEFVGALIAIGQRLSDLPNKHARSIQLLHELSLLNLNLPAQVWLPLHSAAAAANHYVVRVPPQAAAVLNSKDKAPYMVCVEVVTVQDVESAAVPAKCNNSLRPTRSEEKLCPPDADSSTECTAPIISVDPPAHEDAPRALPAVRGTATDTSSVSPASSSVELRVSPAVSTGDDSSVDCWSQEDDAISQQYSSCSRHSDCDQLSLKSTDTASASASAAVLTARDIRQRLIDSCRSPCASYRRDPEDPSSAAMREPWQQKQGRLRAGSPYGHLAGWRLVPVIVKCGDDLRQELLACQLLTTLSGVWRQEGVPLRLRPYHIVVLSERSGLIETVTNAVSLHQLKKLAPSAPSLRRHFEREFGTPSSERFLQAQRCFVESCAAYCLVCYLLQLKDRHNGNILLDDYGQLVHIDFGFMLCMSPKNLGFECSPFKLTEEFVEVMDGVDSDMFQYFRMLMLRGLLAARKHHEKVVTLVEIMRVGSHLPCFRSSPAVVDSLRSRFHMNLTEEQLQALVDSLIESSLNSLTTKLYDGYQYYTNGIL